MVTKPRSPAAGRAQGGIVKKEGRIYASKVMLSAPSAARPPAWPMQGERKDGKKVRVCKKCGAEL